MSDRDIRTPKSEIHRRIQKLQAELGKGQVDAALILQRADLYYFAGTVQQANLYVPVEGEPLLLANRNFERARRETPINNVTPLKSLKKIPELLKHNGYALPASLGMELDVLPANMYFSYQRLFEKSRIVDVSHPIRSIRAVKSAHEVGLVREAARLADEVADCVPSILREGMTELELAGRVESEARKRGHQGILRMRLWGNELFFGHLMAGPAAAVPSYLSSPTGGEGTSPAVAQGPGFRRIQRHEPVLVDYVFAHRGYLADHTRIFSLGPLPDELVEAHEAMLEVQKLIKKEAKPGTKAGDLFEIALERTNQFGYADYFMGGDSDRVRFVGHGIGIEVDEYPFLAQGQKLELEEGMIIALEPKLVFPDKGVVGIENTHVVTTHGLEQLTRIDEKITVI
jgi:Xaa-Pro aminopeptidase